MKREEIENLIKELIGNMSIAVKEVSPAEEAAESAWFKVEVSDPHFFTGRDGEALSALNHLVRKIIESKNKGQTEEVDVLIDINGFQKRKIDNVRAVAHMMAERARYFKSNIEIDPMPAFERRIVHEFLSTATDLKTESEGTGPSRRVVIKYIGSI